MSNNYLIGLPENLIPTPGLIVDLALLERNMEMMQDYLSSTGVNLRPHVKTHKTPILAHLQVRAGARGLCCATVAEAEAMVHAGLNHILIANQVVGEDKIRRVVNLASYADLMVAIDDVDNMEQLSQAASSKGVTLGVLVDFDVGMGRCGVRDIEMGVELAKKAHIAKNLSFRGVMGYEGHAVFIADRQERARVGTAANELLVGAAKAVEKSGIPVEIVSAAGTGTFDIAAELPGITEIQAGSYIFMDGTYQKVGLPFQQSLTVLTSVLSCPEKGLAILDVGMKSISAERAYPTARVAGKLTIESLSEEHAITRWTDLAQGLKPGDKLKLIPSHCCTTVNLYAEMYVVRDGKIVAIWPITAK